MSYSCTDFTDSVLDALKVAIPTGSYESPSEQADIALLEIERLQRIEKELRHALLVLKNTDDRDRFVARVRVILTGHHR